MGNFPLYKIEYFHMLGTSEFVRVKVAALNFFHPTAFPPFHKVGFLILRHSLWGERIKVRGKNQVCTFNLQMTG
jgi:hypothetical protein